MYIMTPVPGGFWLGLGWRIHCQCTLEVLPRIGSAGSRGRAIRRVNTGPIVCEILKIGGICTFDHDLDRPNTYPLQLSFGCIDVNSFPERYVQAVELSIGGEVLRCAGVEDPMVGIAFFAGLAVCLDAGATDHI